MSPATHDSKLRCRTVFVSDIHLGFKGCRAGDVLKFLSSVECEQLYLVGDIFDLWSLQRRFYWPTSHNDVLRAILDKARAGVRVVYVPGNHDRVLRDYAGWVIGRVEIAREIVHTTSDGRRLLVRHGDEFDSVIRASPWLESLGNRAYVFVLRLNRCVNAVRNWLGYPYWSVAAFLKHKVKNAVQYIANFERAVALEARRLGVDGMVCGHIHRPEIRDIDGVTYCNDGDWVESCSALVEDPDGRLRLIYWTEHARSLKARRPEAAAPLSRAA